MSALTISEVEAAHELLRRSRARASLEDYAQAIDVPGRPVTSDDDEWMFSPIESPLAKHHSVILQSLQRCMTQRYGRLMIFAPPGSAKSSYASVVAPTWYMGNSPGKRIILTSYATGIAAKQSRRARQICRSNDFNAFFGATLPRDQSAVDDWALSNRAEFMAAGILAGVTGNRAEGLIIDDPVAGREEAESETIRKKTLEAYQDDLLSRLVPGGWCVLMMTRWHEHDLAGAILPDDYDGRSGQVQCRDGMVWNVLRIPAQCDRADDPIGRKIGGYLWPEWFDAKHWRMVQDNTTPSAARTWSALYQQDPRPASGTLFKREHVQWYDPDELPIRLRKYLASDFAVTKDSGDFTEHGVGGIDDKLHLWFTDWDFAQAPTNVTIARGVALTKQHTPLLWLGEKGVIEKAIGPSIDAELLKQQAYVKRELLPTIGDKTARCQAFRGMWEEGRVHLPRNAQWAQRLLDQLTAFPAGKYDDCVDVCGMFGRAEDQLYKPAGEPQPVKQAPKPFTEEWWERDPRAETDTQRARYHT